MRAKMDEQSKQTSEWDKPWVFRSIVTFLGLFVLGIMLINRYEDVPTDWERCVAGVEEQILSSDLHTKYTETINGRRVVKASRMITVMLGCGGGN
ncbi:hypothetical protein MED193_21019 [Roseobacter sp. MED193]|nr:hypothetical protein MED193_21019 [Roseobacter sp. MED193]